MKINYQVYNTDDQFRLALLLPCLVEFLSDLVLDDVTQHKERESYKNRINEIIDRSGF